MTCVEMPTTFHIPFSVPEGDHSTLFSPLYGDMEETYLTDYSMSSSTQANFDGKIACDAPFLDIGNYTVGRPFGLVPQLERRSSPGKKKTEPMEQQGFHPYSVSRQSSPSSGNEDGLSDEQLLRRRQKNREAAQKSRLRKRMKVEGLEVQLAQHLAVHREVVAAKAAVDLENERLRAEVDNLKRLLTGGARPVICC